MALFTIHTSSPEISIHALREEGDPANSWDTLRLVTISIHALREEGDSRGQREPHPHYISIHALREEGDAAANETELVAVIFLSTPSARRATPTAHIIRGYVPISIHALREEGDPCPTTLLC